jgi:uncharacterized protein YcgL (UPF0745 family)
MENLFFKELISNALFKKLVTALPFLRKEELKNEDLEEIIRMMRKEGYFKALRVSGQDKDELKQIVLESFETASSRLKERFEKSVETIFKRIENEK